MSCLYEPKIRAEFGKGITDDEIRAEFQAIEDTMLCVATAAEFESSTIETIVDLGAVVDSTVISSANGIIQYLTVEGDVQISIETPADEEPRLITLVIADGGSGRFNFPLGAAWASLANGVSMDGKPWDNDGLAGDYGAIVTCVFDGIGWVYMVFSRHDIDLDVSPSLVDLYRWR